METAAILVLITAPDDTVAEQIARHLVEQKLAACVNLLSPTRSVYRWEGQVETASEVLLIVKTRQELFHEKLVPAVQAIHPYTTPEIIALPISFGLQTYLNWIEDETL